MASFYIAYDICPYAAPTRLSVPYTQVQDSLLMNGSPSGAPWWNGAYYNMIWVTTNDSNYQNFNLSDSWVSDQSWTQNQYSYAYSQHPEVYYWPYLGTASTDDFTDQIPSIRQGYPIYFYGPWRGPHAGEGGDDPQYQDPYWSQSFYNDYDRFYTENLYDTTDNFFGITYPVVAGNRYLISVRGFADSSAYTIFCTNPHNSPNGYYNWSDKITMFYNTDPDITYEPSDFQSSTYTYEPTENGIIYIYFYGPGWSYVEDDEYQWVEAQIRERKQSNFSLGGDIVNSGSTAYVKYKSDAKGTIHFKSGSSRNISVNPSDTYVNVNTSYSDLQLSTVGSKTFTAWFEPSNWSSQPDHHGYLPTGSSSDPSATATITVLPPPITITLNMNGGVENNTTIDVVPGTAAGEWTIDTIPTRPGFTFYGFYSGMTANGTRYSAANGTTLTSSPTTATTLYAGWVPTISYTVTDTTVYCTNQNHEASSVDTSGGLDVTISSAGITFPSGVSADDDVSVLCFNIGRTVEYQMDGTDGRVVTFPYGTPAGEYELEVSVEITNGENFKGKEEYFYVTVTILPVTKYPDNTNPQKYKNTSGTTGYNIVYNAPSCTLTNSLSASGGTVKVVCAVTNSTNWYWKYTNNTYSSQQTGTEAGTARWRITSNGNSRFSHPSSGASNLVIGGTTYATYATGTSATHSNMTTNVATDTVKITSYNVGDTTKNSGAKSASVSNALTTLSLSVASSSISYNSTTTCNTTASYTSGSTLDVTSNANTTYTTNPNDIVTITK